MIKHWAKKFDDKDFKYSGEHVKIYMSFSVMSGNNKISPEKKVTEVVWYKIHSNSFRFTERLLVDLTHNLLDKLHKKGFECRNRCKSCESTHIKCKHKTCHNG